jgi:integrase
MATARKLPSGRWRVQVWDKTENKRISFTEDTKRKAEYAALEWQLNQKRREMVGITVGEAIDKYIDGRRGVLSPSTIQGYESIKKYYLSEELADTPISSVTQEMVQSEIMRLSNETAQRSHKKISAKTVHNFHGLLSGAFKEFAPGIQIDTALPKIQKRFIELPPVEKVIKAIKGTDIELPCMLAMWLSLSVSEIRGISVDAIKDGVLTIKETCVQVDGVPVYKEATKAYERTRKLAIPPYIMGLIEKTDAYKNGSGYIETRSVTAIGCKFRRVLAKAGVEHMTFHQLRHMNASVMSMLNIPEKYAQERGGWKTPHTMKRVYQHTFSQERENVDRTIDKYFEKTIGAE